MIVDAASWFLEKGGRGARQRKGAGRGARP